MNIKEHCIKCAARHANARDSHLMQLGLISYLESRIVCLWFVIACLLVSIVFVVMAYLGVGR